VNRIWNYPAVKSRASQLIRSSIWHMLLLLELPLVGLVALEALVHAPVQGHN
jgi:hypothetical protein